MIADKNNFEFKQRLRKVINSYTLDVASLTYDLNHAIQNGAPKRYKEEIALELFEKQKILNNLKLHNFKKLNFKI